MSFPVKNVFLKEAEKYVGPDRNTIVNWGVKNLNDIKPFLNTILNIEIEYTVE
jgi:hypothetical protein